jgi:hypothetical protein
MSNEVSYMGNSSLKPVGHAIDYTVEQVKELIKCSTDPLYFIENYCYIVTLDHGLQLFKLYDVQKKKVDTILNNRKVILMEGRQQGKSITAAACILWYTLFQESKTVAILANKKDAAREVLYRYQIMYENLPLWMQQGVKTWNKGDVELENGSRVFTAATVASGIRGKSVNWLYIDEAAIIPNTVAEEFFTSVYPTISAGETTKILLTSTPMGYNHFWKFWNEAEQGRNGFVPLFVPYWEIPGRTDKWAAEQKSLLGELRYNQEVLCKFLGSSATLISGDTLSKMSPKTPVFSNDGLDVYEEPIRASKDGETIIGTNHSYVLVADTSRGVGGDYSAFVVIDVTEYPYKLVAKYRNNKIHPLLYTDVIHKVARDYNKAYCLLEINDNGQQVSDSLWADLEYENLFFIGNSPKSGQFVSSAGNGAKSGVSTSKQVKRLGCSLFKGLVENNKLLIFDADIISEMSTFIENTKQSYEADEGYHDDLVMCLVLFGWLSNDPYFKEWTNTNLRKVLFESQTAAIEAELTPFGIIDDGIQHENKPVVEAGDLWFTGDIDSEMVKLKNRWLENV